MKKISNISKYIIFALSIILIVFISAMTTLYGDDFIYGTYFLDGIKAFFSKTYEHYIMMNGRALVHFVLELILIFRDRLFMIIIPLLLLFVFISFIRSSEEKIKKSEMLWIVSLYLMGIMCVNVNILREAMLWMSGAMNYIFPLALTLGAFYLHKKIIKENKISYLAVFLFVLGATTEQCGTMAICSCVLYTVFDWYNTKKLNIRGLISILFLTLGFLTVVFSPGTSQRIGEEAYTQNQGIFKNFNALYTLVFGKGGAGWVFFVSLLMYCLRLKDIKVILITVFSLIVGIVSSFYGMYSLTGWVIACTFLIISIYCFLKNKFILQAILILSALLSVAMLVVSTTYGYRNLMPCILILILFSAVSFYDVFGKKKCFLALVLVIFAVSVCIYYPTLKGYKDNRKIINENLFNITNEGDGFYYNVDINPLYGYNQFYVDSFYHEGFKKIYNIDDDTKIFIKGKDFLDLFYNGKHCENPIYILNDKKYYPMRSIIEAGGGQIDYDSKTKSSKIVVNGKEVYYNETNKEFVVDGEKYSSADFVLYDNIYKNMFRSNIYLNEEAFIKLFGIDLINKSDIR